MELTGSTAQLISTGVQTAATVIGAVSQIGAANAEASSAKENAKIADAQAASRADAIRRDAAMMRGAQKAAGGATGLRSDAFDDVIADSDYEAELDAMTAIYEGKLQSRAYKSQASQAKADATSTAIGGVIGAGAQAMSGYAAWKRNMAADELLKKAGKV